MRTAVPVFPLVGPGHPFGPLVERMRSRLAGDPRFAALDEASGDRRLAVESEIKAARLADGSWAVERAYCSVQRWDGGERPGFRGAMLHFRRGREPDLEVHAFPADPRLPQLAAPDSPLRGPGPVEVLRYVPLRRLTFATAGEDGAGLIGKFKRASMLETSYERLVAVSGSARAAGAELAVPAPLGIDRARGVFFQERLAGRPAAELVDEASLAATMEALGSVQAELHQLAVEGVPRADPGRFLAAAERDLAWIAFSIDGAGALLDRIGARLADRAPDAAGTRHTLCHGDFVPSQLLCDGGRWAVLDLDLASIDDPCRDVAIMLASLPFEVPYLAAAGPAELERARAAYLAGYERRAGAALEPCRLTWHRLGAHLYYLSMRIAKGRAEPDEVERSLEELTELADGVS